MEKIRILCFGDSNTWGYISGSDHQRYGIGERWTSILSELLGNEYEVIEEGLSGRTLTSNDMRPGKEGKNGYEYLLPCLDTHDPIDLVVLMLGTNELRAVYNKNAKEIGEIFEKYFVEAILNRKSECKESSSKLLIITPPIVNEDVGHWGDNNKYIGASKKSRELNNIYKTIAEKYKCYFLSNEELETGIDGIHLTKESHNKLANMLSNEIRKIYKKKR